MKSQTITSLVPVLRFQQKTYITLQQCNLCFLQINSHMPSCSHPTVHSPQSTVHGPHQHQPIQRIDDNLENSRSFELNNIDNISVGTSSSTNVHNIGVGTSSDTNNPLNNNDIDECLRIMRKIKAMKLVLVYITHLQIICFKFVNF